ncbi:MAG: histidine phosphatase family protein [Proteobacteria bacterium]|nr:histidine phosphatase family protein [Pseudomonadota bacterium]
MAAGPDLPPAPGDRLAAAPFYYLRHGETDWNREHRAQGHNDIPLNATGLAQAEAAQLPLARCDIATICTSPLQRARATAEIVNQTLRRPLVVVDALKECGYGVVEGSVRGNWFPDWRRGGLIEGAETFEGFMARALGGLNQALAHPGPVLIVAHAGIYWAIQRYARLERTLLENCRPVRHDPPSADVPGRMTTVIE